MDRVTVREARANLRTLLDRVEAGEEIIIVRRGRQAARLVPARRTAKLPSLARFRKSIHLRGEPLSKTVIRLRQEQWR